MSDRSRAVGRGSGIVWDARNHQARRSLTRQFQGDNPATTEFPLTGADSVQRLGLEYLRSLWSQCWWDKYEGKTCKIRAVYSAPSFRIEAVVDESVRNDAFSSDQREEESQPDVILEPEGKRQRIRMDNVVAQTTESTISVVRRLSLWCLVHGLGFRSTGMS